jgi:hypothetical protein
MVLQTATGQALPTEVSLAGDGDGIAVYAVDSDGPVLCYWALTPAGAQVLTPKGVTFVSNKTYWFGSLLGFSSPVPVSSISVGPSFSTTVLPPSIPYLYNGPIKATLTAIPAGGGNSRQLQIAISDPRKSNGF